VVLRPDRADTKDRTRAYRQKPKARGFAPAPVAADPRCLDVFVPLGVAKTLPVETERHAFAYVFERSGTFSSASQPFGVLTEVAHAADFTPRLKGRFSEGSVRSR
jgi:hypothetical protein